MPWKITPLVERERRLREGIAGNLGMVTAPGRASNIGALTAETAAEIDDLHQHTAYQARQMFAMTADAENLETHHGNRWGLPRHQPQRAAGNIVFSGTDGIEIPAGAALRHADGREYTTTAAATIAAGTATTVVEATEPGIAGNIDSADTLTLVTTIAGIASTATIEAAITGGAELEDLEAYRARILFRQAHPPGAGHLADYAVWTQAVPGGITDVWVIERAQGHGTVTVRFAAYDAPDGPIPNEQLRQAVADHLEGHINPVTGEYAGRPAGIEVFVLAPDPKPIDLDFAELEPDTAKVRAAIQDSMRAMLKRRAAPGATIRLDWINEAISQATGEDRHRLNAPAADITCGPNELAIAGALTVGGI